MTFYKLIKKYNKLIKKNNKYVFILVLFILVLFILIFIKTIKIVRNDKLIVKQWKNNGNNFYLKDNKIIICGGAPCILEGDKAKLIDSYDTVIRVNMGNRILKDEYIKGAGDKCDIFIWGIYNYDTLDKILLNPKYKNSYHMITTRQDKDIYNKFKNILKSDKNIYNRVESNHSDLHKFNDLSIIKIEDKLFTNDNKKKFFTTGLITIITFLLNNFKDITITGFSLEHNNKVRGEVSSKNVKGVHHNHDLKLEVHILNKLLEHKIIKTIDEHCDFK
jgi:hypothetical protein